MRLTHGLNSLHYAKLALLFLYFDIFAFLMLPSMIEIIRSHYECHETSRHDLIFRSNQKSVSTLPCIASLPADDTLRVSLPRNFTSPEQRLSIPTEAILSPAPQSSSMGRSSIGSSLSSGDAGDAVGLHSSLPPPPPPAKLPHSSPPRVGDRSMPGGSATESVSGMESTALRPPPGFRIILRRGTAGQHDDSVDNAPDFRAAPAEEKSNSEIVEMKSVVVRFVLPVIHFQII